MKQIERKGKFRNAEVKLPPWVKEKLEETDPDWDYAMCGEWLVMRAFDEGEEFERVACKVIYTKIRQKTYKRGSV